MLAGGCAMHVTRRGFPMLNLHAQERSRCSILEQGSRLEVERNKLESLQLPEIGQLRNVSHQSPCIPSWRMSVGVHVQGGRGRGSFEHRGGCSEEREPKSPHPPHVAAHCLSQESLCTSTAHK